MVEHEKKYLPHGVTVNEFLERLNPEELDKPQKDIVYSIIKRRTFEQGKVLKKWWVIVDAKEPDEGYKQKNRVT